MENEIGNYIKMLRKKNNLKIKDLSYLSNVNQSYISRIEHGTRNPSAQILKKIAPALKVTYKDLLKKAGLFEEDEEVDVKNNYLDDDKDINKTLNATLEELENSQEGLMFNGEPLDDETRELLKISLENSIRLAKHIAESRKKNKK